jgi:membrane protein DedA with SNARE-associated domain
MIDSIITWLEHFSQTVPLPLFIFCGAIIEELIAPIPSPLVMALAGTIAAAQQWGVPYILFLSLIGSAGKTLGACIFYVLGDKIEDVLTPRFGKFFGVTHDDLEQCGSHFTGTWKDELVLTFLRSIPVMPSTPISLVCGALKIKWKSFLLATFCGFYLRDLFFLMIGFTGFAAYKDLMSGIDTAETVMKIVVVGGALLILAYLYYRRVQGNPAKWFHMEKKN